jgi:hypothetical protein
VFVLPERAQPDQFGAQQGAPEQPLVAWFDAERAGEADQDLEASESDGPSRVAVRRRCLTGTVGLVGVMAVERLDRAREVVAARVTGSHVR